MNELLPADSAVAATAPETGHEKLLAFMVGGETMALSIEGIKEIIEYGAVTRVPMAPAYVRGVLNLRGAVVPVVDLAVRLGRPAGALSKRTCIVIVEVNDGEETLDVGVVVDLVNEVMDLDGADVEPAPAFGARIRNDFIRGMGRVEGRFVVILEQERVLAIDELAGLGEGGL